MKIIFSGFKQSVLINLFYFFCITKKASAGDAVEIFRPPDLRRVTVLRKAEWLRIQDELKGVNREKERMRETTMQRKSLHLQSQEVVKLWPNTIAVSSSTSVLRDHSV